MWKHIKIGQRSYMISCFFGEDRNVTFVFYDHKESWCEILTFDEVKRKAKLFNRRYDYNEQIVRDTLAGGELELATLGNDQQNHGLQIEKMSLKLKYRVKNCPFHYEWSLKKQTAQEVHTTFVTNLCTALEGCQNQIRILTDNLRKKDAEILQYRKEGAILNRKTLATKLFDFEEFDKEFESSNKIANDFNEFGKFITSCKNKNDATSTQCSPVKAEKLRDVQEKEGTKPKLNPLSPGQRKRKILELKQKNLERIMKNRKQGIEYESSQSQTTAPTTGSSQSTDDLDYSERESKSIAKTQQEVERKTDETVPTINAKDTDRQKSKDLKINNTEKSQPKVECCSKSNSNTKIEATLKTMPQQKSPFSSKSSTNTGPSTGTGLATPTITATPRHKNLIKFDSDSDSDEIVTTPKKLTSKCTPSCKSIKRPADSDSHSDSDDIILTPRKITTRNKPSTQDDKLNTVDKKPIRSQYRNGSNTETDDNTPNKQKVLRCLAFDRIPTADVVEISTDSECSEQISRYPKRRNTTNTPTKNPLKARITRSSPNTVPLPNVPVRQLRRRNSLGMSDADFKIFECSVKKLNKPPTKPVIVGEISSQLDAIRKELQSLEALRLADLKKRTCKV